MDVYAGKGKAVAVQCREGERTADSKVEKAEQRPHDAADELGGNVLPGVYRQGQHQVALFPQQFVVALHAGKKADGQHRQHAQKRGKGEQPHKKADPGHRMAGVVDIMPQQVRDKV